MTRPRGSNVEDRALASHSDRRSEGLSPLLAGPRLVQLVGDVGEHDTLRAGPPGVVARLRRSHVPSVSGALGTRQRGLDEEEVGVASDLDQLLAGPAVGA